MTLTYLLDTNIISVPVSRSPDRGVIDQLEKHGAHCAIASPVWHELQFGSLQLPSGRRRRALQDYLHEVVAVSFPILAYGETAASWHAAERARLLKAGKERPFVDGQIAAIAVVNELVLVTRNKKDFRDYKGLKVEEWATP